MNSLDPIIDWHRTAQDALRVTLRVIVLSIVQNRFAATNSIETRIMACVENDAEFWNFTGRLIDVFDTVHSDVRGRVKQFVDFRNWLAHARHAGTLPQPAPLVLTPRDVHQVLTTFLQQAGLL